MPGSHQSRAALFLLPSDTMGGAENVLRMTAEAALAGGGYGRVIVFVLAGNATGTLDALAAGGAQVVHSGARSEAAGLPALARTLAGRRYALVMSSHTHLNAAASAARRVGLLRTDRLVARESTLIFERDLGRRGAAIRSLYRLYGAQDRIVCQTERMARSLTSNTGGRLEGRTAHVANPVDLARFARAANGGRASLDGPLRIVWCGRLAPVKSPERALDALAILRAGGRDARLTMVGDGPLRVPLEHRAERCGLADVVTFTGRLARPETAMREATLGLVTSDLEGFPNVILEMLAAGVRRIVSTDCAGGLAAIPGVSVAGSAPEALAAALAEAAGRPPAPGLADYLAARSPAAFLRAVAA